MKENLCAPRRMQPTSPRIMVGRDTHYTIWATTLDTGQLFDVSRSNAPNPRDNPSLGDYADDIPATFRLGETKARYDEVCTALNGYFDVRRNLIVQRVLFNKRHQFIQDTFIQDL